MASVIRREASAGLILGTGLCVVGFFRVYLHHDAWAALAIATAMFFIVLCATLIGALLPLTLYRIGIDPANAGPAIQVCVLLDR
jgi:magnesium transporter